MARSSHLIDSSIQYSWRSGTVCAFLRQTEAWATHAVLRSMHRPNWLRPGGCQPRDAPWPYFCSALGRVTGEHRSLSRDWGGRCSTHRRANRASSRRIRPYPRARWRAKAIIRYLAIIDKLSFTQLIRFRRNAYQSANWLHFVCLLISAGLTQLSKRRCFASK